MKTIRYFITLLAILACFIPRAQQVLLRHYTAKDGLPGNTIYHVLEDSNGFLWFCTSQGICQFDGHQFRTYTTVDGLPDNEMFSVKEDIKGRLWFTGYNNRACYMLKGKIFNAFNDSLCSIIEQDKLLNKIKRSSGYVTPSVLFEKAKWPNVKMLAYSYYDLNDMQYVHIDNGVGYFLTHSSLVAADRNKVVEVGLKQHTCCFYYAGHVYFTDYTASGKVMLYKARLNGLANIIIENATPISCLIRGYARLNDSTLLLASDEGALSFSVAHNVIDIGNTLLKNIPISSIARDAHGNIWFATLNDGVFMLPESHPVIYKTGSNSANARIEAIYVTPSEKIVAGYSNGTMKVITKGHVSNIVLPGFTSRERVLKIGSINNDKILIGTDRGLIVFDTLTWKAQKLQSHFFCWSATKDFNVSGSDILLACVHGAGILNAKGKLLPVLWHMRTTSIERCEDTCWLGTLHGVYIHVAGKVIAFNVNEGLTNSRITAIRKTAGNDIVFCTHQNGVFIWDRKRLQHLNEQNGLSSSICKKMLIDKHDNIWIVTNNGLDIVTKNAGTDIYSIKHMPLSEGIPANEIQDIFIQNNKLYLSCVEGIVVLDIERQNRAWPVKAFITTIACRDSNLTGMDGFVLNYNQNDLTINYTGIALGDGNSLHYKYVLEGQRTDTVFTKQNSVNLNSISAGKYRFLVWAKSNNNKWSSVPAILTFTINHPFWQTYWFSISLVMLIAGIVYMLVRIRIKNIKTTEQNKTTLNKKMAELEMQALRAQINPHFIFNALNSIQNYYYQNDERNANRYMTTFAKLIRQTLTNSRENWLSLTKECAMIEAYICLEQMRFKNSFEYTIAMPDDPSPDTIMVPAMIVQPYVENAINHGLRHLENTHAHLSVSFSVTETQLVCIVDDNGVGLTQSAIIEKKDKQHSSLGMEITKSRIDVINQIYNTNIIVHVIDKSVNNPFISGTTVKITIPLMHQKQYNSYDHAKNHNS